MKRCTPRLLAVILPFLLSPASGLAQDALSNLNTSAGDRPSLVGQARASWLGDGDVHGIDQLIRPVWLMDAINATEGAAMFNVNPNMPTQFMIIDDIDLFVPGDPKVASPFDGTAPDWFDSKGLPLQPFDPGTVIIDIPVRTLTQDGAELNAATDDGSSDVERDAAAIGMTPLTLEYNRSLITHLDDQVAQVEGGRDAAGNLTYDYGTVNPFDDNDVIDVRPVSLPVIQGFVLKREHVAVMFDAFGTQLEGIQQLPDGERLSIARDLLANTPDLQDAYVNMITREPSEFDGNGRRRTPTEEEKAVYGEYQQTYYGMLGENPLLAIFGDFSDSPFRGDEHFHQRLFHDFTAGRNLPSNQAEREDWDADLLAAFDDALDVGIANATGEADRVRGLNTFEDMLELAGPEYALADQQLRDNASFFDSELVGDLLDSANGEAHTILTFDKPADLFISSTLAAGAVIASFVIPGSGGVVITVVFAGADVGIEGYKVWELEGQMDREAIAGAVLGFDHFGDLANATSDQWDMAFMAATFGLLDAANLVQLRRGLRGAGAADDAAEAAGDAGRLADDVGPGGVNQDLTETVIEPGRPRAGDGSVDTGPRTERIDGGRVRNESGGFTDEELAFWRGRNFSDEPRIQEMDDLVRAARSDASDIPHETIDDALDLIEQRAMADQGYGTIEALDDLKNRIGIAEMDVEGHVLAVRNQAGLDEFAEGTGGAVPRNIREVDTFAASDLKSKASISNSGRPVEWTPADRAMAQEVLADENYARHLYEPDEEAGLIRVFSDTDIDNIRQAFPEYVIDDAARVIDETPTVINPGRPRAAGGAGAVDQADDIPPTVEPGRLGQDETPTVLNPGRERGGNVGTGTDRIGADKGGRAAGVADDAADAPGLPDGMSVDDDGVITIDLTKLGWKLPGAAGELIQVGNDARNDEPPPTFQVFVTSSGGSTGEVMDLNVLNGGKPVRLQGEGLVLEPVELSEEEKDQLLDKLAGFGQNLVTQQLFAYCLQFLSNVPLAGELFKIAPPEAQQAYSGMRQVLTASEKIRDALNPDSDPEGYFQSARQWAIWTQERNLNAAQFEEAFLGHTQRNVEASGQEWTPEIEQMVKDLIPNRWFDVQKILAETEQMAEAVGQ